jgi:hypothetical protein
VSSVCLSTGAAALRHRIMTMYVEFLKEQKKFRNGWNRLNRTAFSPDVQLKELLYVVQKVAI